MSKAKTTEARARIDIPAKAASQLQQIQKQAELLQDRLNAYAQAVRDMSDVPAGYRLDIQAGQWVAGDADANT